MVRIVFTKEQQKLKEEEEKKLQEEISKQINSGNILSEDKATKKIYLLDVTKNEWELVQ